MIHVTIRTGVLVVISISPVTIGGVSAGPVIVTSIHWYGKYTTAQLFSHAMQSHVNI